ncbi:acyl-CoA dehydrogenase family protein [Streptomyces sp. NPDC006743]|uniref:acyl-CoA dehydrogenase family protein n=1 Tax=Streptomyces sp. NPDC006743 TaxID=3154480 RepID=UPI0034521054
MLSTVEWEEIRERVAPAAKTAERDLEWTRTRRRLTADIADSLVEAGFARHFVPRRWEGAAGTFTALLTSVRVVAESCASTAWCAALYASNARLAAYLPEEGQRELWADGPDVRIAAAVVPARGEAVRDGLGWRLTGAWPSVSGVDHAAWVLMGGWAEGPDGDREHRVFAVPRGRVRVVDTWRTMGMRGTGSNTVEAEGVFVPAGHTAPLAALLAPLPGGARCHTVPYPMIAGLVFAAPLLGAARGAQQAWLERTAGARDGAGVPVREKEGVRAVLARSSGEIAAAQLLLERVAERADRTGESGVTVGECRRDTALAAELCASAVDRLMRASGLGAAAEDDPLQRRWHDVVVGAGHATLAFEQAASAYGQAVFASPWAHGEAG